MISSRLHTSNATILFSEKFCKSIFKIFVHRMNSLDKYLSFVWTMGRHLADILKMWMDKHNVNVWQTFLSDRIQLILSKFWEVVNKARNFGNSAFVYCTLASSWHVRFDKKHFSSLRTIFHIKLRLLIAAEPVVNIHITLIMCRLSSGT